MTAPSVVLVTRHFWPDTGAVATALARLSAHLVAQGARVTVLTPRWQSQWPEVIEHRGARVLRLIPPSRRLWGSYFYGRRLVGWLRRHRESVDVVCVSTLKHDAYAVLGFAPTAGLPVVIRAEQAGRDGDCHWQLATKAGQRIKQRTMQTAAFIAPTRAVQRELVAAGYPPERIYEIPHGVPPVVHGANSRQEARDALAESQEQLTLPEDAPLVVYLGQLDDPTSLEVLLSAWSMVLEKHPAARLWLVGLLRHEQAAAERIHHANLLARVRLTGGFDEREDILQAAQLLVAPSAAEDASLAIQEAMACGLPVVAAESPAHRELIEDGQQGYLVGPGDARALAARIVALLDNPGEAARLGEAGRMRWADAYTAEQMALRHLDLFATLHRHGVPSA